MPVTREELIKMSVMTKELMDEVVELRDKLERVTRERDRYKECWETSCWTHDELTIPLEIV